MNKTKSERQKTKFQAGFTILEVLIVIVIIAVMTIITWRALNNVRSTSVAKSVCEEAASAINKARTYALTGECSGNGATDVVATVRAGRVIIRDIGGSVRNCDETINFSGLATCQDDSFRFSIPAGSGPTGSFSCSYRGATKRVVVDRYSASCP